MKKLLFPLLFSLMSAPLARAAVTAAITFEEAAVPSGHEGAGAPALWAHVRFTGVEKGESFAYEFRWTAPRHVFTKKDGTEIELFKVAFTYRPTRPVSGGCASCRPYCADTMERGCWRTRGYRGIETTTGEGKTLKKVRATGAWRLEVVRVDDGKVLGSAVYEVR